MPPLDYLSPMPPTAFRSLHTPNGQWSPAYSHKTAYGRLLPCSLRTDIILGKWDTGNGHIHICIHTYGFGFIFFHYLFWFSHVFTQWFAYISSSFLSRNLRELDICIWMERFSVYLSVMGYELSVVVDPITATLTLPRWWCHSALLSILLTSTCSPL